MSKMKEYKMELEELQFQDAVNELIDENKELFMELNDNYTMTKQEEQDAMKEIFAELDKQERMAIIENYVYIAILSSITLLIGLGIGLYL